MRANRFFLSVLALGLLFACGYASCAQDIAGQLIASQYGTWRVQGYAPDTYSFAPASCRVQGGASFFNAFTVDTPVLIVDGNPALSEVVTPSSVTINNNTCSISISPTNHHNLPFYLTSATGGLQEAINANLTAPGTNTILLGNAWYQLGGTTGIIATVQGTVELGLIDITTTPSTWYHWNGRQYVANQFGNVFSVFGRDGNVVAETGDYTCAQVTGCPQTYVASFNTRTGAVSPATGDYSCAMVTGCNPSAAVNSVFGRTGAVVATTGDYTCPQVTNCFSAPVTGFVGTITSTQASGDTTAAVTLTSGTIPTSGGYVLIGSEWEQFTGVTSLGGGSYELTGMTRGLFTTTAASHTSTTALTGAIVALGPSNQEMFVWHGGTATSGYFFNINCPTTVGSATLQVGCNGSNFSVTSNGSFQEDSSSTSYIAGGGGLVFSSTGIVAPYQDLLNDAYKITQSVQLVQTGLPSQMLANIGFKDGISGGIQAVQAPTAAAPFVQGDLVPVGSTTYTYECIGTDAFGGNIPGTAASINNLAASGWGPGKINVYCPIIPGAVTTSLYRLAGLVGDPALIDTSSSNPLFFQDGQVVGTGGSPSGTNTSLPAVCTNGTGFCVLSGTSSTPTATCSASTVGWEYHDTATTPVASLSRCLDIGGTYEWVGLNTSGQATLASGTVTVSTTAACAVGGNCNYVFTHCGVGSSTAIGSLSLGTVTAGTSFVINSLSASATVVTGDLSTVCWRIN